MVTDEEIMHLKSAVEIQPKNAYQVTSSELSHFIDQEYDLASLISDRKKRYEKEANKTATQAYLDIEEKCQISIDTFKKAMCHTRKVTRTFLYKFVVGFGMDVDEANDYFELCGGPLSRNKLEDYICINALRDKDSIQQFVNDIEKHTGLKIGYNSGK